ncbi:MAG: type II toxin-antitoxin system prevent-host-death family antitoxin [Desulfomonilaceae bacterium]|nr:type II toxin-antitoxin system prevent-host-death family antitoxin [Desulfomonilaceae bacterium]
MIKMTTMDLRKKLGHILDTVAEKNEQVIISRANRPLAVILSIAEFEEKVLKKNRKEKLRELAADMDDWRALHRKETAKVDAVRAVREIRDSR